jgi:hypothetical protein
MTLAGLNGISIPFVKFLFQSNMFSTSYSFTAKLSQFLTADSNRTLIENGKVYNHLSPIAGKL